MGCVRVTTLGQGSEDSVSATSGRYLDPSESAHDFQRSRVTGLDSGGEASPAPFSPISTGAGDDIIQIRAAASGRLANEIVDSAEQGDRDPASEVSCCSVHDGVSGGSPCNHESGEQRCKRHSELGGSFRVCSHETEDGAVRDAGIVHGGAPYKLWTRLVAWGVPIIAMAAGYVSERYLGAWWTFGLALVAAAATPLMWRLTLSFLDVLAIPRAKESASRPLRRPS